MSDWQVGDLALCVKGGVATVPGRIYTVTVIASSSIGLLLQFRELEHRPTHSRDKSLAARFRKITPPAADEFDHETIALMNRVGEPVQ